MDTKQQIVTNWLPRYTGVALKQFGRYILLTNFAHYIELFAEKYGVEVLGRDRPMLSATAEDITILNFGMGSAMAATVMDLLSAIDPKGVLFLGKCGGLKQTKVGDFLLPIAAKNLDAVLRREQFDVVREVGEQDVAPELLDRAPGVAREPVQYDLSFGLHTVAPERSGDCAATDRM